MKSSAPSASPVVGLLLLGILNQRGQREAAKEKSSIEAQAGSTWNFEQEITESTVKGVGRLRVEVNFELSRSSYLLSVFVLPRRPSASLSEAGGGFSWL